MDLSTEIKFQTTRSGGKGGQNVNKVETAVIANFHVTDSVLLSEDQKKTIQQKLSNRITKDGFLQVKSQTYRTQLENKEEAANKIAELLEQALQKKKLRLASRPSKAARQKRLEGKTRAAERKQNRKKLRPGDF